MDYTIQWLALIIALLALIIALLALLIAGVNSMRLRWFRTRVEQQLRTIGQRESWQRRVP